MFVHRPFDSELQRERCSLLYNDSVAKIPGDGPVPADAINVAHASSVVNICSCPVHTWTPETTSFGIPESELRRAETQCLAEYARKTAENRGAAK